MNYWRYLRYGLAIVLLFATLHVIPLAGIAVSVSAKGDTKVETWAFIFVFTNCLMVQMVIVLTMFWNIGGRE